MSYPISLLATVLNLDFGSLSTRLQLMGVEVENACIAGPEAQRDLRMAVVYRYARLYLDDDRVMLLCRKVRDLLTLSQQVTFLNERFLLVDEYPMIDMTTIEVVPKEEMEETVGLVLSSHAIRLAEFDAFLDAARSSDPRQAAPQP